MKKYFIIIFIVYVFMLFAENGAYAYAVGSRASYTKGGWVGAKYIAMGKAAEATVNDVFAI